MKMVMMMMIIIIIIIIIIIAADSRDVPGKKACDKRHPYLIIIITIIIITEELSQPNEKSDAKQYGIRHTKSRLRESLKKKWKTK